MATRPLLGQRFVGVFDRFKRVLVALGSIGVGCLHLLPVGGFDRLVVGAGIDIKDVGGGSLREAGLLAGATTTGAASLAACPTAALTAKPPLKRAGIEAARAAPPKGTATSRKNGETASPAINMSAVIPTSTAAIPMSSPFRCTAVVWVPPMKVSRLADPLGGVGGASYAQRGEVSTWKRSISRCEPGRWSHHGAVPGARWRR